MRVAVLGCGSIGRRHARNLKALGCDDLLLYDPVPEARRQAADETGAEAYAELADVWSREPEIAVVTAPSNLHVDLSLEAARRGCHLFVEKPLAHTLDGVDELAAEADARGLTTMVACNMRFHPGPAAVKRLVDGGAVGPVIAGRIQTGSYLPRWRPWQDHRRSYSASPEWGGAILDCIHEIDLALWYLGPASLAAAVSLPARSIGLETDGLAELLLRHDGGVVSSVHLNFVQRDYRRTAQIIGTEGTVYWDFGAKRVDVYGEDGALRDSHGEPEGWEVNQMYLDEMTHFLDCAREGRATSNPLSGGAAALRVALAARNATAEVTA